MDSVQESYFNSVQSPAVGSVKQGYLQNLMSMSEQNKNTQSQSAVNTLPINVGSMQPSSNVSQQQQMKQEQQQFLQTQQTKQQLTHHHIQQQQMMQQQQRQKLLQQQPPPQQRLLQQQKQQQTSQLSGHQVEQVHSVNELIEMKVRQGSGIKSGNCEHSTGQSHNYCIQQLKQGAPYPVSSPQTLQASSPQISQQSSPQIDQNGLLSSIPKAKARMQSANSPLVVTPSTPFTPSPTPVDSEKPVSAILSVGYQQTHVTPHQPHSFYVSTPGISASPFLAECTSQDGNHTNVPTSKTSATKPVNRLIKAVQILTPKALTSTVSDIGSVINMIDGIAGLAPGNGSRTAISEDLVVMTKSRLQARNFMVQYGGATAKKMKCHTSAMPSNDASSAGSVNDNFKQVYGFESPELNLPATSHIKRLKHERKLYYCTSVAQFHSWYLYHWEGLFIFICPPAPGGIDCINCQVNHALLEDIIEINEKLIDTVVDVNDSVADSVAAAAAAAVSKGGNGVVVKFSYTAVALSPDLKTQFASSCMSPITPLRLLVPSNYPKCSPVPLDSLPVEPSKEFDDLWTKVKSKFSIYLCCLPQPMSLREMAKTWDACAWKVILEYTHQTGVGSFSSIYG